MNETGVTGGYLRHRDRMIQESVYEDLRDTLIACRWLAGTTTGKVSDPYNNHAYSTVTTTDDQVLPLLEGSPLVLIDYFPEAEGSSVAGEPETSKTAMNTLAINAGMRGESAPREMGSSAEVIEYRFNMAFYAISDGVAMALFNDLADRYRGRLVRADHIFLWDYNTGNETPVSRLDIDSFGYSVNTEVVAPRNVHLYFGELILVDEVD